MIAVFFKVRREHFTTGATLAELMRQFNITNELLAEIDASFDPSTLSSSPCLAFITAVEQSQIARREAQILAQSLRASPAVIPELSSASFAPPLAVRDTPMPGSKFYAAINNLITNNY